ncbi:CPCC family cysteine-rich protein [Nocardia acidivorans]|uniref:CPCC family cysteine-rich protein n=1 Tax=Nocardia acidivorans TaxID=404580 RepID=UPI000A02CC3C
MIVPRPPRRPNVIKEINRVTPPYPCPACGHRVFDEPPGCHLICPVCFWEDDGVQLRCPTVAIGANRISLVEAQRNVIAFGACKERVRALVRPPAPREAMDPAWRCIGPSDDFEDLSTVSSTSWPEDWTTLYWWLPTFWRA